MGSAARWGRPLSAEEEWDLGERMVAAEERAAAAVRQTALAYRLDRKRPRTEQTRAGDVDALADAVRELEALADASDRSLVRVARQALSEAESLRWVLAMSGARIAVGEARRLTGAFLDGEDLIQEGFVGLWRAAKRYDPRLKLRFSTYARWWVRAQLTRAVDKTGRTVRLPSCAVEQRRNLQKLMERYDAEGRHWTIEALAQELSYSPERVAFLMNQAQTTSLDHPLDPTSNSSSRPIGDLLASEDAEDPSTVVMHRQEVRRLYLGMRLLSERQRYVLAHRFGLDGLERRSLASIGRSLRLSRERVRQIELESLRVMREHARAQ